MILSRLLPCAKVLAFGFMTTLFSGCGEPLEKGDEIRWGTSAVGSSGHRAMVGLAAMLNEHWEGKTITVQPMPGAVMTIRGYSSGELEGYYGADIAFHELAEDRGRFSGYRDRMNREPVQSFWAYSLAMGVAVRAQDREQFQGWGDLDGRPVFTGPGPWDTRAHLERLFAALDIDHRYVELDLGMAGSQLATGAVEGIGIYTTGESDIAPWIAEAERGVDLAVLNPTPQEEERLVEQGFEVLRVPPGVFRTPVHVEEVVLFPFYYGFHLGTGVSADEVYGMLILVEEHAEQLARTDPVFRQIANDMPEVQRRGVARAVADLRVHPGLARYMRERGVWDAAWDERVAEDL